MTAASQGVCTSAEEEQPGTAIRDQRAEQADQLDAAALDASTEQLMQLDAAAAAAAAEKPKQTGPECHAAVEEKSAPEPEESAAPKPDQPARPEPESAAAPEPESAAAPEPESAAAPEPEETERALLVVLDMDETMIGLSADLHHRCTLAEGSKGRPVAIASPSLEEVADSLRAGLLRPGLAEALEMFRRLEVPVVVYTKAQRDWAELVLSAVNAVIGFEATVPDGLFAHESCEVEVVHPGTGEKSKSDKSLAHIIQQLRARGGFDWLTSANTLMLDDLNSLPAWEKAQLVHVCPYRWTELSGAVGPDQLARMEVEDDELYEQIELYLQRECIRSLEDPAEDRLFEGCRLVLNELNRQLAQQDKLWPELVRCFEQVWQAGGAGLAERLAAAIDPAMISGGTEAREKVTTLVDGRVVETTGEQIGLTDGSRAAVSVQYEGPQPVLVQLTFKNKVIEQKAAWPGQPMELALVSGQGKYQCKAWNLWRPEEGGVTWGRRFEIAVK